MAKAIKKAKRKLYQAKEWAVVSCKSDGSVDHTNCTTRHQAREFSTYLRIASPDEVHRVTRISIREIPERRAR